jgi:hypothetical protein
VTLLWFDKQGEKVAPLTKPYELLVSRTSLSALERLRRSAVRAWVGHDDRSR